jgi:hypothetical protein
MDSENLPKKLSRSARRRAAQRRAKLAAIPQTRADGTARPAGEIADASEVKHVLHQPPFPDHARSIYDQERERFNEFIAEHPDVPVVDVPAVGDGE